MRHAALFLMLSLPLIMASGGRPVTTETRPGYTCAARNTGVTVVDVETGVIVKDPCSWWVKANDQR